LIPPSSLGISPQTTPSHRQSTSTDDSDHTGIWLFIVSRILIARALEVLALRDPVCDVVVVA
jgi:hypothetical protein